LASLVCVPVHRHSRSCVCEPLTQACVRVLVRLHTKLSEDAHICTHRTCVFERPHECVREIFGSYLSVVSELADSTVPSHCLILGSTTCTACSQALERAANKPFACWVQDSPAHRFICITMHSHAHCTAAGEGGVDNGWSCFSQPPPPSHFPQRLEAVIERPCVSILLDMHMEDGKENVGKMQVHESLLNMLSQNAYTNTHRTILCAVGSHFKEFFYLTGISPRR